MSTAFHFDAERHLYLLGGRRLWSVTEVLAAMRWIDPTYYTWASRMRGKAVHIALQLHMQGGVDWESLRVTSEQIGEDIEPYVRAGVRWLDESGFQPRAVECAGYDKVYEYGWCFDLDGFYPDGQEALVDWKSCETPNLPAWELQLAAYGRSAPRITQGIRTAIPRRKVAVQLMKNGKYQPHIMTDINAEAVFLSLHTALQHGLKTGVYKDERPSADLPDAAVAAARHAAA